MDPLTVINQLAIQVQRFHLPARHYLDDPQRSPFLITPFIHTLRQLLAELVQHVRGKVPRHVFAVHFRETEQLIDQLVALEAGFTAGVVNGTQGGHAIVRRRTGPNEGMREKMQMLVKMKCTDAELGEQYGKHKRTIARWRGMLGIYKRAVLHSTPDEVLQEYILHLQVQMDKQRVGAQMTHGWLTSQGVNCTREQVRDVLRMMDPDAVENRGRTTTKRRRYHVEFPNSLWHLDGHHKLIRWKMVIHGGIDGKSHLITFMDISDNNRAQTVRELFLRGTQTYGWPERVRSDHGGENLGVGEEMVQARGEGRFLTGKSTHNQRIERLWVDVQAGFAAMYHNHFYAMEEEGLLDSEDAVHLYCLHYVFLPVIRHSIRTFVDAWNWHNMSTEGLRGHSPIKQWHLGLLRAQKNGFYFDFYPTVTAEQEAWFQEIQRTGQFDVRDYQFDADGIHHVRPSQPGDPNVEVDRIADELPWELHDPRFISQLGTHFPVDETRSFEECKSLYVRVAQCVENHPAVLSRRRM